MSYQIYGYVQIKDHEGNWETAPVFHRECDRMVPVVIWHNYEVGTYLWQNASYVGKDEIKDFMENMNYVDGNEEESDMAVKAISLAYMKYLAVTFDPEHNDYDGAGDEERIKPGLESIVRQIDAVVEFSGYYRTPDEVRYIFHESY